MRSARLPGENEKDNPAVNPSTRAMTVEYCMARGFESKDVEFQQAEAERKKAVRRSFTPEEREELERRHTIELSLVHTRRELDAASQPAHRRMLQHAIESLEARLSSDDREDPKG
jgi:hypothetical protein